MGSNFKSEIRNPKSEIEQTRLRARGESDEWRAQSGFRRDAAGIDYGHHYAHRDIQAKGTLEAAV